MRGQVSHTFLILFHVLVLAMVLGFLVFHATRTDTGFIQRSFRSTHLGQSMTALSFWPNQADYAFYSSEEKEYRGWQTYLTKVTSLDIQSYDPDSSADPLKKPYAATIDSQFNSQFVDPEISPIVILKGDRLYEKKESAKQRTIDCPSTQENSTLIIHSLFGGEKDSFYDQDGQIVSATPQEKLVGFTTHYFIGNEEVFKANPGRTRTSSTDSQILEEITRGSKRSYDEDEYKQSYTKEHALITITDSQKEFLVIKTPQEHYNLACSIFNSLISDPILSTAIQGGTVIPSDQFTIEFQVTQNSRILANANIISSHLKQHFGEENE